MNSSAASIPRLRRAPSSTVSPTLAEGIQEQVDAGKDYFLLDVREPHEFQIANLNGYLIPLGDLEKRVSELDPSRDIVIHCKSGVRSQRAAEFLQKAGFNKVQNLAGGINAWSDQVDPKVAKY